MALYRNVSWDELNALGSGTPSPSQTRIYNALGRNTGSDSSDDNFFTKRWKSIDNAIGTTGAAVVSAVDSARENAQNEARQQKFENSLTDIYQQAGFNNADDYYNAKEAAEKEAFGKIGFDIDSYWNNRANADIAGDNDTIARLDQEYNAALGQISNDENLARFNQVQDKLKNQTSANAAEQKEAQQNWANYRTNSDVGKRVNQDRGKFLGSAMNTLSTAADILLPGAGVVFNAGQGAWEGLADELEQNGLENFDLGRAGQNMLTGAITGGVTGALNKGVSNKLAQNGGNLFKGGNKLTQAINKAGSSTAPGRIASTLATGAGRGALSGAVGGATGAGLQSAVSGQDVGTGIQNALQGAVQGAQQGALAGGAMAGANMALNATPGVGNAMRKLNEAGDNWNESGDNFAERWKNTRNEDTWGNRFLDNQVENTRAVKQGFRNVGEGLNVLAERSGIKDLASLGKADVKDVVQLSRGNGNEVVLRELMKNPEIRSQLINNIDNRVTGRYNEEIQPKIIQAIQNGIDNDMDGFIMRQNTFDDANAVRNAEGKTPYNDRQTRLYAERTGALDENNPISGHYMKHSDQLGGSEGVVDAMRNAIGGDTSTAYPAKRNSTMLVDDTANQGRYPASVVLDENGGVLSVSGRTDNQIKKFARDKSEILNNSLDGRSSSIMSQPEDGESGLRISGRQATDSIVSQNSQNVNATPETEVYRALTGDNGGPTTPSDSNLMYGESDLANRTRRGMLADGLERFGNSLEGAQANITRAAAKDLGIESTGKVIENVRKKTGLTNLETQAKLARELTGGENSLMDTVQRNAIGVREDGKPYKVDTTPILDDLENIVNKYADTNMFGSQNAKERFINNLKRDISNMDTDVLGISNRMKANAADLRGKGVVSATPSDAAKAKIYSEVASKLDDLSYKAIPQENVEAMFDATISEMRGRAAQAEANGNRDVAKAYRTAANSLDAEPRTIKAFRSFKKDFVDVSKINELTARAENGAAVQMGRSFGDGIKRFVGTVAQRPTNALLAKAGGAINNMADRVSGDSSATTAALASTAQPDIATNSATNYSPATQLYNTIGRTEGEIQRDQARDADYLADAAQEAEIVDNNTTMPTNSASTSVYNALTGNSGVVNSPSSYIEEERARYFFPPTGDYMTDMLSQAMRNARNAEDYDAFGQLYEMYQNVLTSQSKNSSKDYTNPTNWSSSDRSTLLEAQNGLNQIDQLESLYNNAGGGQGWLGGSITNMGANIADLNTDAKNYNQYAKSIGTAIVKNIVNLGGTEADAERYMAYLPSFTDTKEQAASKLEYLRQLYQQKINNLYSAYNAESIA